MRTSRVAALTFAFVWLLSAVAFAALAAWVPLPGNVDVPLLDLGKITGYTEQSAVQFAALVVALYALYWVGYRLVLAGAAPIWSILVGALLLCGILLWAYPATAADVFGYVAQGREVAIYHVNPFLIPPDQVPDNPIVPYLAFPGEPSQYGPVWALVEGAVALAGRGSLTSEVLLYKALAAVAQLASAGCVLAIARRLGGTEAQARGGCYLFAWNPLLLWEMVGNGHNDGVMMLAGLGAIWLLVTRRWGAAALVLVALGTLVKLPLAVMGPVLAILVGRQSRRSLLVGVLGSLALAVMAYLPFWQGPETVTALDRGGLLTASLADVLDRVLFPFLGDAASAVAQAVSYSLFGLAYLLCLVAAWRSRTIEQGVRACYQAMLAFLLLGITWFQAWYVIWALPLGAALPRERERLVLALLSAGAFLSYAIFIYLWVMGVFPDYDAVEYVAYALIVVPALLGWIWRRPPRVGLRHPIALSRRPR